MPPEECRHNDQVILEKIESLTKINEEQHNTLHDKLTSIDEQVKKTNGRVTKLEDWKNMVLGGLVISQLIILPITLTLIYGYLSNK